MISIEHLFTPVKTPFKHQGQYRNNKKKYFWKVMYQAFGIGHDLRGPYGYKTTCGLELRHSGNDFLPSRLLFLSLFCGYHRTFNMRIMPAEGQVILINIYREIGGI